jgi:hypothetical protein
MDHASFAWALAAPVNRPSARWAVRFLRRKRAALDISQRLGYTGANSRS